MRAKFAETESPSICAALPRMADPAPLAASVTRRKKANSTDRRAGSRDNVSTERADSTEFKWVWGVGKLSVMNEANAEKENISCVFSFSVTFNPIRCQSTDAGRKEAASFAGFHEHVRS